MIPSAGEWNVGFMDESRDIASEYKGGLSRYAQVDLNAPEIDNSLSYEYNTSVPIAPTLSHQPLPSIQGILPTGNHEEPHNNVNYFDQKHDLHPDTGLSSVHSEHPQITMQRQTIAQPYDRGMTPVPEQSDMKEILNSQEETLFMQVFVEEVGIWMDSMDSMKHVSIQYRLGN